jgi:3-hydroxyisobutyrate dehydrogenase
LSVVGFVGLGNMGRPMARNLLAAGFELVVRDVDPARADELGGNAGSPGAFGACDVVVTMLPNDAIVRDALLGWGLAAALKPSAVVVDMSSSNPTATRALASELPVALVDAPVSGGVPRAETATLSIMVGSDDEAAVARAREVLEALGDRIFRVGPLGAGHALKALNNYLAAAAYAATAEALAVGQAYGLDPETLIAVVNTSTGRSFSSEHVYAEHVVPGRYATGFTAGLLAKDVAIAADIARSAGIDAPALELVNERWAQAVAEVGPGADHSEAHKPWYAWDAVP